MEQLKTRIQTLSPQQRRALKQLLRDRGSGKGEHAPLEGATYPLSPPQQRLWLLSQLDGASSAYNIPGCFQLTGAIDHDALTEALAEMQQRHEILRTTFYTDGEGRPMQRVAELQAIDFQRLPSGAAPTGSDAEIAANVREVLLQPFDLTAGPAWRARLLSLDATRSVLILSFHHLVFDGWSLGVFASELFANYTRLIGGSDAELPEPKYQYRHYVGWRRGHDSEAQLARETQFWRGALAGELPVLELPADKARPRINSYRGSIHKCVLSREVFDTLKSLARRAGTTPYVAFMSLLKVLLYRYTGQTDLIVGTPVSGRERAEDASLIGALINTLPIRSRLDPQLGFREMLGRVRTASLDAFAHQLLSFDAIVEAVNPSRSSGCNPVFQVLYTYQNALPSIATGELQVQYMDVDCGTAKFDLSLDVFEGVDGPTCIFEYSSDLFTAERIERMARHFAQLAQSICAAPDAPINQLRLLTEEEIATTYACLQAPAVEVPYTDFVSLFARRALARPDNCAVRDGDSSVTYAELDAQANRIAHVLIARGVGAGSVVGVCMARSPELIAALVGVMKTGAAFVALDPSYPPERLAFIAADAGICSLIRNDRSLQASARINVPVLNIENAESLASLPATAPACKVIDADSLAYVVYTSGTTGQPKGVMITHRNWTNAYAGWEREYDLENMHAHLQMASFSFDVFCGDLIRALGSGKTLVLCPHELFAAPDKLHAWMKQANTDFAEFVPGVFRNLADHLLTTGKRLDFMQILVVASDSWYVGEYRRYRALLSAQGRLVNSYGISETTIDSTWFESSVIDYADGALVPIGKPFPNVAVFVADENLQLLPAGVTGEICIAGAGVSRGYINRPDLTAQKFIVRTLLAGEAPVRLYRTGDLGRMRSDGSLELIGRRDTQIKIRGMRVELGEIETLLRDKLGLVQDCAVTIYEDVKGNRRIVAYVVEKTAAVEIDQKLFNAQLAEHLPAYMLPAAYVKIGQLPLSPNGKVDRRKLPAYDEDANSSAGSFVSPRTLSEEMLATIWTHVFNLPRVGVNDSFFELGGHSLLAFQIVARIREAFRVDLPLQALFEHPTIAGLAGVISDMQGKREQYDDAVNSLPTIVPDPASLHEPFPLTEVQQAYWLGRHEIFEFGNVTTHSYDEIETTRLDVARFQQAWNRVIARHDMLRAIILADGTQQILRSVPVYEIPVLDLRHCDARETDNGIEQVRAELSHQQLNVHSWPVFEVRVTLMSEQRARIHFSSDALIFDVWSFVIMVEDLIKLYLEPDAVLPKLELSFRDYVLAEEGVRKTERYRKALDYWRDRVATLPPAPQLPSAMDTALVKKPHFTRLHAELPPAAWERLKKKTVRAGLTTTGLLLAAYAEVLAAYSRDPAFSLNLTFLNRHPLHPQVNDIVGEFTSLTLLSVDQSVAKSFVERARKVQADLWHDLEHHDISGVQVLRDLTRAHGGATRAKMPVVFTSALVVPIPKLKPEFPLVPVYGVTQTSQVWLDCGVWEEGGALQANWDVVLDVYPPGLIQEMFAAFWGLVQRLSNEDAVWQEAIVVHQIASETAAAAGPVESGAVSTATLDSLFLESLSHTPNALAIITPTLELTYQELGERAAWVRRRLDEIDVPKGQLVAIAMFKGWEQAAAALGIMNAGAAYMPVDPALPDERMRVLFEEGRVAAIITTADLAERCGSLCDQPVIVLHEHCHANPEQLFLEGVSEPTDIAYVIFTSGSTGKPKGVVIDHRGAVNTILDVNETMAISASDRVLALSSLSFDLSVYDLFGLLAVGGAVVIPDPERRLDPAHWADLIDSFGVTVWNSVPALCGLMVDFLENTAASSDTIRHVMLSGDWIPVNLPGRIRNSMPGAKVTSLGGATEASIWSIWYPVNDVPADWTSIPYGKAMRAQEMHVLDHRLQECPTWVTGELYIGGIGLALGYWGDEERTARAFITQPHTGKRLYRTGDLGRRLPDGNIEFLGREDQQVKAQGHRIELGDIEAALLRHPAVRDAAAVCQGERHGEKRLGAFYCVHPESELDATALREFLLKQLPEYMVPHSLLVLDALPLSSNGKVDRKALPTFKAAAEPVANHVPPRDAVEATVLEIWKAIFGDAPMGVEQNFFAAGGDSMMAIKLLGALRLRLKAPFELKDVFLHQTIAAQAARAQVLKINLNMEMPVC